MYNIINRDSIYIGFFDWRKEYQIQEIGDERALIRYLAGSYRKSYIDDYDYINLAFDQEYFDGYGRNINPRAYAYDAWIFYIEHIKDKVKNQKFYRTKNNIYQGIFRKTPVAYTGKRKGGPCIRSRKLKHIVDMYGNPEYKDFNRGSRNDYPDGWWDDWIRSVERNWKSQRKVRHQWQK